jgi:cobyrinic acid a,c-diamide synthase
MAQTEKLPRIIIAGTHSGAGKTSFTMALIHLLTKKGMTIQPFKAGPDYIDPSFHSRAAGRICYNLDTMLLSPSRVRELFCLHSKEAEMAIIEGVMGLYDGAAEEKSKGRTSHLAKVLRAPVILMIDAKAMAQSAGAVALGFKKFDLTCPLGGFILNRIGSERHYEMCKESIEKATGLPVFGYLPKDPAFTMPERHLGLVPAWEDDMMPPLLRIEEAIEKYVDLEKILDLAKSASEIPPHKPEISALAHKIKSHASHTPLIAYAHDKAFQFYYGDNLAILEKMGARLIPFSPLEDKALPVGTSGVYIGGGFPELYAAELAANTSLMDCLKKSAQKNMPILAECGGLMYLTESIERLTSDGIKERHSMAAIVPGRIVMGEKLRTLGYCSVTLRQNSILAKKGSKLKGHFFHWSHLTDIPPETEMAFDVIRRGEESREGFIHKNVLASYLHLHFGTNLLWAKNFVLACAKPSH